MASCIKYLPSAFCVADSGNRPTVLVTDVSFANGVGSAQRSVVETENITLARPIRAVNAEAPRPQSQLARQETWRPKLTKRHKRMDSCSGVAKDGRKWRSLPLNETGFSMSLLPRRSTTFLSDTVTDRCTELDLPIEELAATANTVDGNTDEGTNSDKTSEVLNRNLVHNASVIGISLDLTVVNGRSDDGSKLIANTVEEEWLIECKSYYDIIDDADSDYRECCAVTQAEEAKNNRPLRPKKKWRIQKARRQVKTRHCRSVSNSAHSVTMYVNHRVVKRMTMIVQPTSHRPCAITLHMIDKKSLQVQTANQPSANATTMGSVRQATSVVRRTEREDSSSRLIYAVDSLNADSSLPVDVATLLLALQHRELDPNDYDLLLLLDDRIKPHTADELQIASLPVDVLSPADVDDNIVCVVCLERFQHGQRRKCLPCGHSFHDICIDDWLRHSSTKCPLDNIETFAQ